MLQIIYFDDVKGEEGWP